MTFWNHILMKIGCAFGFINRTISMSLTASNSLTRISYTLAGRRWQQRRRRMRCTFIFFSFPPLSLVLSVEDDFLYLQFSGVNVVWYFFEQLPESQSRGRDRNRETKKCDKITRFRHLIRNITIHSHQISISKTLKSKKFIDGNGLHFLRMSRNEATIFRATPWRYYINPKYVCEEPVLVRLCDWRCRSLRMHWKSIGMELIYWLAARMSGIGWCWRNKKMLWWLLRYV